MKLSISNIAWPSKDEKDFFKYIKEWGCSGLEIAPGILWPEPVHSSRSEREKFRSLIESYGLELSAMQALLYGKSELGLFRSTAIENQTADYLKQLCVLAADLNITVLVFGSPGNRKRDNMPVNEAFERAAEFFTKVAHYAEGLGVCLCIEPLMPQETDFITTAAEGLKLVNMVNSPGFGLHLDAKAVNAEGDDFSKILNPVMHKLKHFHINDPGLVEVNSTDEVNHSGLAKALCRQGYDRYVSIEMRASDDCYNSVKRSIQYLLEVYIKSEL